MSFDNYLPNEILLEIISYFESWSIPERQAALASCCAVNRQWYDVAVRPLYQAPCLSGSAYALFVRTICPSVLAHIKPTCLSALVQTLDLSTIIHQGTKSTTARLLNRTKPSLTTFIAPQASFAINCWASLSKCTRLRTLDLSLVSEQINFQSLTQTLRNLPDLRALSLPRCSATAHDTTTAPLHVRWPPHLEHLALSGTIAGKFLWDMLRQPHAFPPSFSSLAVSHCPALDHTSIRLLTTSLAPTLTTLALRNLPAVHPGRFNRVLDWCPRLERLTIALDSIDMRFGGLPPAFSARHWPRAKPLQSLALVSCGRARDARRGFTADDLATLVEARFLGRLRWVRIARSSGWGEGGDVAALREVLCGELDRESWEWRRWHYEGVGGVPAGMGYEQWIEETGAGRRMRPYVRMVGDG